LAPHIAQCGGEVKNDTVDEVAAAVLALRGHTPHILFPVKVKLPPPTESGKAKRKSKKAIKGGRGRRKLRLKLELLKGRLFDLRKRGDSPESAYQE